MNARWLRHLAVVLVGLTCLSATPSRGASTKCTMRFELHGWSAFYKTASGSGTITCDNGQSANVIIRAKGGGLTVGRSKISDGRGSFSAIANISEVYGSYAAAEANAGMVRSASAQVMTKGTVSLELTGKGAGVDLGVSFGRVTISKHK